MRSQEFLENTFLFQNLFSLKPENKRQIFERKLELYRQAFQLLREENLKLKQELVFMASSS
ncbi:MAG: hypothetical protein ABSG71_06050 [Thermodesulfobacteriota bacterium]|jgi:hypothetical protein